MLQNMPKPFNLPQIILKTCFSIYMEGKLSSVFETQFPKTVIKSDKIENPTNSYGNMKLLKMPSFDDFISEEAQEEHVNHMLRNSSIVVAAGIALMAPLAIVGAKGKLPKPIQNFFSQHMKSMRASMQILAEKPEMNKAEMICMKILQKTTSIINSVKSAMLNFTPFKDSATEQGLRKIKLGKVCDKTTGFFEEMAVKMTSISYKKSSDSYAIMKESLSQSNKIVANGKNASELVEINGITRTVKEWAQIAKDKSKSVDNAYDAFRPEAVTNRHQALSQELEGFSDSVWENTWGSLKEYWNNPSKITSFVLEDMIAPIKQKFSGGIVSQRKVITNSTSDVAKEMSGMISNIESKIDMGNKGSIDLLKKLKATVKDYKINQSPDAKKQMMEQVDNIMKEFSSITSSSGTKYNQTSSETITKSLESIKSTIQSSKQGQLEEVLEIYKHILPEKEYVQLAKAAKESKNSLKDAVSTESEKFIEKIRDLKSGSAITDVSSTLITPTASIAVGMSMAKTKEKKRSVLLNLGVPILTGVAVSTAATVAMMTAGPSLVLGAGISLATKLVCSKIDKSLKKRDAEKLLLAEQQAENKEQLANTTNAA